MNPKTIRNGIIAGLIAWAVIFFLWWLWGLFQSLLAMM